MSNHDNHRRDDEKRTEHASRWENLSGSAPSVARARKSWKLLASRAGRRTGVVSQNKFNVAQPKERPKVDLEGDEQKSEDM